MRRKSPFLHFLVGAVAITVTTAGAAVWLIGPAALESCSKTSYIELPLPDGGRIRNEFWFESGFLDSSYHSEVYYISPGWWVAKEHVFTLAWNQEDTLRTAQRTQFYQDGDRKAFAIWRSLGSLAAKRIMMTLPKGRLRTWVSAIRDFPCFVRGFQPQDPAAQEVLVATTPGQRPPKRNPGDLVVDLQYGLLGDYNCLFKWDVEVVVSITGVRIPYGGPLINRYMVVPLGWNIVSPFQYGTGPVESLYFRVERPNPSW